MPFIDEQRSVQPLDRFAGQEPDELDPGLGETFAAGFRRQNIVASYLSSRGQPDPYAYEDDFDAIDYVKDDARYSPYADRFAGVFNRKAADALKIQIDREEQDKRTIDAAGAWGTVAEIGAGVIDLPTLLPVGGAAFSVLRSTAGRMALGAGLDASVSEIGLRATQQTRSPEETALNIGGSIIMGGALGGLVGRYLDVPAQIALTRKLDEQGAKFQEAEAAVFGGGAQSAGAAARDAGPLRLKDEALISRMYGINQQDPMIRLQLSDLDEARGAVRGLAETPLEYAENAQGMATEVGGSVETRMKLWNAPLAQTLRNIDVNYARYFNSAPEPNSWQVWTSPTRSEFARRFGKSDKLTYAEFKAEVSRAAYSGGKHEIPEVAAAAAEYRKIDDAMKQAAIDGGLFPEDVAVKGDVSHLFRMYDREKIIARRNEFADILRGYFSERQVAARFRAQEQQIGDQIIRADKMREDMGRALDRLSQTETRLAERSGFRQRRTGAIEAMRRDRADVLKTRAPKPLVNRLRNMDENAVMVDAVKASRAAERSRSSQQPFAKRNPVLATIREAGGVRIGSQLDGELRAMGVTPKTNPGLFKKSGGIGDVDNIVKSEDAIFTNLRSDGSEYVDPRDIYEAIRSELAGMPLKSPDDIEAEAVLDNLERAAADWLDQVGLDGNATVKEVRDYINRVLAAEKNTAGLDSRISRYEQELEDFDAATDALVNERTISETEAATIRKNLDDLEAELESVSGVSNASPRISMIVDLGRAKRDLFKAKLKERTIRSRVEALKRVVADGKGNDEIVAELNAKTAGLTTVGDRVATLKTKADRLEQIAPKRRDAEKADAFGDLSDAEIGSLVDETINTILGNAEGRIPYDSIVSGPRGPLKERLLQIESERISDFMEMDIEKVLHAQVRTMSADVELTKKFGSVDLKEQILKINDEADRKIAQATDQKERQRLEAARKAAIRDVTGIRDRLRGQYALPDNPDGIVLRAGRVIRNLNYVRLLGGMTVSAIPDMGKVVFSHGLTATFRDGFLPMVKNVRAWRLAADEVKAAGTALDMVLDSRTMAMADITNEFGRHSKFERGLSALSSKYGVVSFMAPWNAVMKQFSGMVTMTNMLRSAERVAKGEGSSKDIRALAASGIDADMASRITAEFAKHGDEQSGILLAKAANWDDPLAREAFRAAVVREVDKTVVTPGQDKPLWMSTELGKIIGQFKSFGISSVQKTMLAGIQQRDANVVQGVMVMLALGALTYKVKSELANRETSDNWKVWAVESFDRSGLVGWLMDANNASEKITRGKIGLSAWTGKQMTRYASRNALSSLIGPSFGTTQDILTVIGATAAGEYGEADARRLRQLLPMQNLFYVRSLFDQIEKTMGGKVGD